MVRVAGDHHTGAVLPGQTHRMTATRLRHVLADPVLAVVQQARAGLGDHVAVHVGADVAGAQLLDVDGQHEDPV